MKIIVVLSLILSVISAYAQEELFIDKKESFSFLVPENYTHQSKQITKGTLDVVVVNDEASKFKYALTIAKVYTDNIYTDLFKPDYKAAYVQNCGCEILIEEEVDYTNFKGLVFTISKVDSGQLLKGYSINTVRGEYLYNLVYITSEATFEIYEIEFINILNSFKIYEK